MDKEVVNLMAKRKMARLSVYMPKTDIDKMCKVCEKLDISQSTYIIAAHTHFLKKLEKPGIIEAVKKQLNVT
jgi:hypothetical protein